MKPNKECEHYLSPLICGPLRQQSGCYIDAHLKFFLLLWASCGRETDELTQASLRGFKTWCTRCERCYNQEASEDQRSRKWKTMSSFEEEARLIFDINTSMWNLKWMNLSKWRPRNVVEFSLSMLWALIFICYGRGYFYFLRMELLWTLLSWCDNWLHLYQTLHVSYLVVAT